MEPASEAPSLGRVLLTGAAGALGRVLRPGCVRAAPSCG
jgi:hypothetical protein